MATIRASLPHEDRTASEPRENSLEQVILTDIREINDSIRLLRLTASNKTRPIKFLPGQWLDTFIPSLDKAGGFTITSTPSEAMPSTHSPPFLELAVQKTTNPPAKWFWRPNDEIIGTPLVVRVGGSFTWPPQRVDITKIERLVLIAGGVGINPLISIFSHLIRSRSRPTELHVVYGTKTDSEVDPQRILFLPRLMDLTAAVANPKVTLSLFLTGSGDEGRIEHGRFPNRTYARRMSKADLVRAIDGYDNDDSSREQTLCYVCGPQVMTDDFVDFLSQQDGMAPERVLCEKWW